METPNTSLVVVGKDAEDLRQFNLDHVLGAVEQLVLVDNHRLLQGYGVIANHYLDALQAEVLGICHADTCFGVGAVPAFAAAAARGALTGVAGKHQGLIRWCNGEGAGPGPVSTLDSCALFFAPAAGLRFDTETFDSFHCCVEDLCLQASTRGIGVEVVAADAGHRGQSTLDPAWQEQYWRYRALLAQKWKDVPFETT